MSSCMVITAVICLLFTTVATIVAFATPNWMAFRAAGTICGCDSTPGDCDCGLWLNCLGGYTTDSLDNCKWFFDDDFKIEKTLPDWFKAVQGLMSCAVASTLLALVIGLCSLCCTCKGCNPHQAAGAMANLTFLLLAVSVCVFGAKAYLDYQTRVLADDISTDPLFSWSFWVAVGATGMSLISSILYFCVGRTDDYLA